MTRIPAADLARLVPLGMAWSNETSFQGDIVKVARQEGWGVTVKEAQDIADQAAALGIEPPPIDGLTYHPRYSMGSDPGWPDLFLVRRHDRRLLVREVKTEKGVVSRRQREVLDLLAAVGLDTGIWRPSDWPRICEELA